MPSYYTDPATGEHVEIKKTHRVRNFVLFPLLGLFAVVMLVAIFAPVDNGPTGNGSPSSVEPVEASTGHTVRYEISGTAEYVTYSTGPAGSMAQEQGVTDWHKEIHFPDEFGSVATLSVTAGMNGGEVTCRILVDDELKNENTSSGQFASADCVANM